MIEHGGGPERLRFEFDAGHLPYLGVMISQGFNPEGKIDGDMFAGLEPTTGIGDDFPTCQDTGTLEEIGPKSDVKFWINLSLIPS